MGAKCCGTPNKAMSGRGWALLCVALFGCGAPRPEVAPSPAVGSKPGASPGPEHAAAGVEPGSHEDWCGEHEVPESLCTRCNASLIAAFKASHDWCAEHERPESQCTICNPEIKIVRPPAGAKP